MTEFQEEQPALFRELGSEQNAGRKKKIENNQ